jgi:thiamine pyrophosphate-dependent acetolactate synthase large subunit-like protein
LPIPHDKERRQKAPVAGGAAMRFIDQAGRHDESPVAHRRQSGRARQAVEIRNAPTAELTIFNRTELTKRLVAKLKHEEAAGIGNTNFDLFAAGHRPQNFYMLGSMGLAVPIALEGDGSILMLLGSLSTVGTARPRNLTIIIMDNGLYQNYRQADDGDPGAGQTVRDPALIRSRFIPAQ